MFATTRCLVRRVVHLQRGVGRDVRGTPPRLGLEEFFDSRHRERCREDPIAGRAWEASELRRKSFSDLHKLWYVLLKERNVLLTESNRARRFGMRIKAPERKRAVRKSMARIKLVLSERRAAYRLSIGAPPTQDGDDTDELALSDEDKEQLL
mmetsp:Transcript_17206/g.52288  ORF Transcript_17206/g.52288 Transcript_17206/m.52288 type:complete len:152 (-) Transcript_17206:180-635(-)